MEIFGIPTQALFGQLLIGLINGSFYALLSLGLAVIFGLLNIINFTHGAQYMFGAFVAYLLLSKFGISYWWALLVAPIVVGATGGVIVTVGASCAKAAGVDRTRNAAIALVAERERGRFFVIARDKRAAVGKCCKNAADSTTSRAGRTARRRFRSRSSCSGIAYRLNRQGRAVAPRSAPRLRPRSPRR